jgi:hypothetical protein
MKKLVVVAALAFTTPLLADNCTYRDEPTSKDLTDAVRRFKYRGKWIHPDLVREMDPWISDPAASIVLAVDVAAAHDTNRYFAEVVAKEHGAEVKDGADGDAGKAAPAGYFGYESIGVLENGTHVLETYSSGGGSGVFKSLLFVTFHLETAYRPTSVGAERCARRLPESKRPAEEKFKRLVMHAERNYIVGDRIGADYAIKGNVVTVTTHANGKANKIELAP